MRIRTKLRIGIVLAVVLTALVAVVLGVAFNGVRSSIERMRRTDDIGKAVFELKILATEYQQAPTARTRDQWRSRYASFLDELAGASPHTERQRVILKRLRGNHASLGQSFTALLGVSADVSDESADNRREQLRRRMTARMDACLLAMVSDSYQLSDCIYREMVRRQRTAVVSVAVSALALAGLIVGLASVMNRAAIRPLRKLQADTAIIGRGDLDHRTGIRTDDEVGALSIAFDAMVSRLKNVMARRDELNREVQQRQRAERDLRKAMTELKRSNEDLEQFAYSASHDLQEPLRKVAAFGSLLKERAMEQLSEENEKYLQIMMRATERMQHLINDLLKYSRVATQGKAFTEVDMEAVVAGVLSDLETRIGETGASVDVSPLPALDADPIQMRQLMQNLIANALKFHKEGENPRVRVDAKRDGAECRLSVEDNGIGFDEKYTDRIFGVFQRLHRRHEYSGSGIGLAVCRRIAERHGGKIEAESKPGDGARFIVTLPLSHEDGTGKET